MMMGEFQSRLKVYFDFFVASCDCGDGSSIFLGSHEYSSYCFSACGEVQLGPRAVEPAVPRPQLGAAGAVPVERGAAGAVAHGRGRHEDVCGHDERCAREVRRPLQNILRQHGADQSGHFYMISS